jgi:MFS family permease
VLGNLALGRVGNQAIRGQLFLWLGFSSGLMPMVLGFTHTLPTAMIASALTGASTAAFMTLSQSVIQSLAPDGIRGRIISANTWHVQGAMAGFNAVNGMLMDLPWMTASLLLWVTGMLFVIIMLVSLGMPHPRTIYARGIPARALAR